jgi:hypothetical protein
MTDGGNTAGTVGTIRVGVDRRLPEPFPSQYVLEHVLSHGLEWLKERVFMGGSRKFLFPVDPVASFGSVRMSRVGLRAHGGIESPEGAARLGGLKPGPQTASRGWAYPGEAALRRAPFPAAPKVTGSRGGDRRSRLMTESTTIILVTGATGRQGDAVILTCCRGVVNYAP